MLKYLQDNKSSIMQDKNINFMIIDTTKAKKYKKVNEVKQQRACETDYCLSLGGATADLCIKI